MRNTIVGGLALAIALGAAVAATPARAEFPERAVTLVVPFAAGGTIDIVARVMADRLKAKWNVPVIVENKPGAGNIVGATAVARAAPDGYTLLFANTSVSVNPSLFKSLPFDTERDLAPVVYLFPSPNVLLAQKRLEAGNLKDLIALARARTPPLTYASVGKGSFHHLAMELFKSEAKVDVVHVPYRGVAPAMLGYIRGEVDLYCSDIPGGLAHIRSGEAKPYAVTSKTRVRLLPDVPSMAEAGLPNYDAAGYVGMVTTGGTPPDAIAKLNKAIAEVANEPAFRERFSALGYDVATGSAEDFARFLKADIAMYARLTRAAGIVPE
jgi:tripartite-type tricarboxylate transporter receptor subunit TctC